MKANNGKDYKDLINKGKTWKTKMKNTRTSTVKATT